MPNYLKKYKEEIYNECERGVIKDTVTHKIHDVTVESLFYIEEIIISL